MEIILDLHVDQCCRPADVLTHPQTKRKDSATMGLFSTKTISTAIDKLQTYNTSRTKTETSIDCLP